MQLCEWLGLAGMVWSFCAGWVIAYTRGVDKKIKLGRELLGKLDDERQRFYNQLEVALKKQADDQRWPQ